jgi:flagellar basal-body rod protein FlgG
MRRGFGAEAENVEMRALAIAATGMSAQEQNLEVIANNIANINTTGFKRSRAEFTDLIYQTERLMGVSNRGRDATIPEGAEIGLGVRTAAIRSVNIQGALTNTGNALDLAINGRGWFQVTTPNGDTVYTRATARSIPTRTASWSRWTATR